MFEVTITVVDEEDAETLCDVLARLLDFANLINEEAGKR